MADSPLQKSPLGLLALWELKTHGDSPVLFGDTVAPVTDATDLYMLDRLTQLDEQQAIPAAQLVAELNVTLTSRQYLHVRGVSCAVIVDAADAAIDQLIHLTIVSPAQQQLYMGVFGSGSVHTQATVRRAVGVMPAPFWLPPGWGLRARAELVTAPAQPWDQYFNVFGELITD